MSRSPEQQRAEAAVIRGLEAICRLHKTLAVDVLLRARHEGRACPICGDEREECDCLDLLGD